MRWILNKQNANKHPEMNRNNIPYTTSIINMAIAMISPLKRVIIRGIVVFNPSRRKWRRMFMRMLGIREMECLWQEGKCSLIEFWRRIIWRLVLNKLEHSILRNCLGRWALTRIIHPIHLHLLNNKEVQLGSYKWISLTIIPQDKASNSIQILKSLPNLQPLAIKSLFNPSIHNERIKQNSKRIDLELLQLEYKLSSNTIAV